LNKLGDSAPQPIKLGKLKHEFMVRPGTNDLDTILQSVVREEYGCQIASGDMKVMVDAGAFIGDTAAYFLSRFPELKVWALEPQPDNYSLALENLAPYGQRVSLLPYGLAASSGKACFAGAATGGGLSAKGNVVNVISMSDLMERYQISRIDLLKIDIEGGEKDVLAPSASIWLNRVDMIMVELHSSEIERSVLEVLRDNDFECDRYRSIWICQRKL
jgi:FkbM family methyltransferase